MKKIYTLCFALTLGFGIPQLRAQTTGEETHPATHDDDTEAAAPAPPPLPYADLTEGMRHSPERLLNLPHVRAYLRASPDTAAEKQPEPSPEVYADRLGRLPHLIAMPYNDVVRQYIDQYTHHQRAWVSLMLGAQNFYIPIFEEALEAEGLPLELKYLPIVESALDPATSDRHGASGLWRLRLNTARRLGLTVNTLVDERRDPVKSSQAAARLLKELHARYGDWTLAIAAYTAGSSNLDKAIRRAGGERDYWKLRSYLPRESRGSVPAFIATHYVMRHHCHHNIPAMSVEKPVETDTLLIGRELHLSQVAEACRLDLDLLSEMNPQYRTGLLPGHSQPCALRLPTSAVNTFLMLGDSVYHHSARRTLARRSAVEPVPTAGIDDEEPATPRVSTPTHSKTRATRSHRRSRRSASVTVRKGDTLIDIARRNGTTVTQLRKKNKIKGSNIRPGDKLRLK